MLAFNSELNRRLEEIRAQDLFRQLRCVHSPQSHRLEVDGRSFLNFSSNDYLGLANHPALKQAAAEAINRFGAGSGASRLICGSLAVHHELEETLAEFKGTPAALSFSSGYAAAAGTICALVGKDDIIILDHLVHACVVDAARLSGAKIRVFAHNDPGDLEAKLKWAAARQAGSAAGTKPATLVITESVFSMDGDLAPLREVVGFKEKYGAWLMLDEAHATGLYGERRRGLAEVSGLSDQIEIQMGTLGKALGAAGGYICGSRTLIDYLVNRARSFIFSTAPVPAAAAAATAGIRLVQSAEGRARRDSLWQRVAELQACAPLLPKALQSAIIPIHIGDEARAVQTSATLRDRGFFVPAVRYPTVARGSARLRVTLTADHTSSEVAELCDALKAVAVHENPEIAHS